MQDEKFFILIIFYNNNGNLSFLSEIYNKARNHKVLYTW
jgi:hypothetical protein